MKLFLSSCTTTTASVSPKRISNHAVRWMVGSVHSIHQGELRSHETSVQSGSDFTPTPSFESLGVHSPIVDALRKAFPNIRYPTEVQASFIPAILNNKDVLLRDFTGTGKSFGLLLALLSKRRLRLKAGTMQECPQHITSLVVVPHRDLAHQYFYWVQRLAACAAVNPPPPLISLAQVLVRDGDTHLTTGLTFLRETPPHILIGTPQAIMDVWHKDKEVLQLPFLSTVVVDEVDYLIETAPKKDPKKSFRSAMLKAAKKIRTHPGCTRELLNVIYAKRKEYHEWQQDDPRLLQHKRLLNLGQRYPINPAVRSPQLVLSSATLRSHLRNYLYEESGWLNKANTLKVKGAHKSSSSNFPGAGDHEILGGAKTSTPNGHGIITHSILVVSDKSVVNVKGAVAVETVDPNVEGRETITPHTIFGVESETEALDLYSEVATKYANAPSPFNPNVLETVAMAFALDVPCIALLVIPASAPVQRAVHELREMGVNAHGLDLLSDEKGKRHLLNSRSSGVEENPTLLVSTLASTRGIDLPELTHVFILGIPEGPRVSGRGVDAYLHIAGRVGRFGRKGKVISIVENKGSAEGTEEDGVAGVTEGDKMLRILRTIEVKAVRFEHFD
ncbi:hypothetical protein AMATHDRAFT_306 [Amanita thiersii Skay4041]|uniref:RNA helicase n=1 Tax=Amanita thiersii Skay4041 TaxID=703135 RepID=A0A2A9P1X2_9AGAR|nr:hypothetical protein AMATHDRAFT_306 [Amanita thiersii Skay4041]